MIIRYSGSLILVDRDYLTQAYGLSEQTIRRRCQPVACDRQTAALLHDLDAADQALATVTPLPKRRVAWQRTRRAQAA